MKYRITTHFNPGILDNAGKAVLGALNRLGFREVEGVRIGAIYDIECDPDDIERIAKNLTNEVMQYYTIEEVEQ